MRTVKKNLLSYGQMPTLNLIESPVSVVGKKNYQKTFLG